MNIVATKARAMLWNIDGTEGRPQSVQYRVDECDATLLFINKIFK